MNELNKKISKYFEGLVVRKDLVKTVKGNAIVPSYVLEYLLGQYCATTDEASIKTGIETVKEILRKHYVHPKEANYIRSEIARLGRLKIIDKGYVVFNDKTGKHEISFDNLGISKIFIDADTVKAHKKLLVGGVWCIADIEYEQKEPSDEIDTKKGWILGSIKPIQLSHFDFESFTAAREQFSKDEWIDILIQSIGFNPEMLGDRNKLYQLVRLIPFCERNYNLIELGPKGTGKSHIYSEFSPHGTLVSGGEATLPKLFINNTTGKLGLVGYWDVVAMDEFSGSTKKANIKLIDTLKNYMANKSFNRGTGPQGAEASMVFIGNTSHNLSYMLKNSDLFHDVPQNYRNSDGQAILDRLHFFIPGWEVDIIRGEMFSNSYGFVVDYLAEILKYLRNYDYSNKYQEYFDLSPKLSTRDRDAINKTFSGLMKIIFPTGKAEKKDIQEILHFSIEGRKRVKDQLQRIDNTYDDVEFYYTDKSGNKISVTTLEEIEYPQYYKHTNNTQEKDGDESSVPEPSKIPSNKEILKEQQIVFLENQKGASFKQLFGAYLSGATSIIITDPYIRIFYQIRNLMEFLEVVAKNKPDDEEIFVKLITTKDDFKSEQQIEYFIKIKEASQAIGIHFTWEFDETGSIHARHIVTDTGWKILLDRGLDIFQHYEMNDVFAFTNRLQQYRQCKAFEVTYIKIK